MAERFYVEIRPFTEDESDPGFRRMGPMSAWKADKVARGVEINLNHKEYYVVAASKLVAERVRVVPKRVRVRRE